MDDTSDAKREKRRAYMRAYYHANPEKWQEAKKRQDPAKRRAMEQANYYAHHEERKAYQKAYNVTNAEKRKAYQKAYYAKNKAKRDADSMARYWANRDEIRAKQKLARVANDENGKRRREKEALAGRARPNVCEICGGPGGKLGIMFDHCHRHGHFRGWICHGCNAGLGSFKDDPNLMRKAIAYLERTGKANPPQGALSGI